MIDPKTKPGAKTRFSWMSFREPNNVTLQCDSDSSCEEVHTVQHLKTLPKDLQPLATLVANPATAESVWLNACVAAGEKSLIPKKRQFPLLNGVAAAIAVAVSLVALLLNFLFATLLSADMAYFFHNVDQNVFMKTLIDSHVFGCVAGISTAFAFWYSLLVKNTKLRRSLVGLTVLTMAALSILITAGFFDLLLMLLVTAMTIFACLSLSTLAGYCREALPKNFTPVDLAKSTFSFLVFPVMLLVLLLCVGTSNYDSTSPYSQPTPEVAGIYFALLSFSLLGQSVAIARASKTTSKAACVLLSACVQAPLVIGLAFTAIVSSLKGLLEFASSSAGHNLEFDSIFWQNFGHVKSMANLEIAAVTVLCIITGSLLGAKLNSLKKKTN